MSLTKEEILNVVKNFGYVEATALAVAESVAEIRKKRGMATHIVEMDETGICVELADNCMGCVDYENITFPTNYLWVENFEEIEKELENKRLQDEQIRIKEEKRRKEKKQLEKELKEYKRLKEKFEETS